MTSPNSQGVEPVYHYLNDEFVSGAAGKSFETLDPRTNKPITTVAEGFAEDIDRAVASAKRAFREGEWHKASAEERANWLLRVAESVEANAEEFANLETLDTGIPIRQTRVQIKRAAENFRFFAEVVTHLSESLFPVGDSFLNYTERKPVGVAD